MTGARRRRNWHKQKWLEVAATRVLSGARQVIVKSAIVVNGESGELAMKICYII